MKTTTGIKSTTKPYDIVYNDEVLFERSNIEESVEIDPVFNTETTIYTYDETEYSLMEWFRLKTEKLESKIEQLENRIEELEGRD